MKTRDTEQTDVCAQCKLVPITTRQTEHGESRDLSVANSLVLSRSFAFTYPEFTLPSCCRDSLSLQGKIYPTPFCEKSREVDVLMSI